LYAPPGDIHYVRDQYGLRGIREPISAVDLVTVGGSATDQRYIDEGQTWQDIMRKTCDARIANAGADGMNSFGHIVAVAEWLHRIPNFQPKTFLHYIGANDASLGAEPRDSDLSGKQTPWFRGIRRRSVIAWEGLLARSSPPREVVHGRITVSTNAPPLRKVSVFPDKIAEFVETNYKSNLRRLLA
jgi:hypothetical protein